MNQILFVGEQPSRPGVTTAFDPHGGSTKHLAEMAGVDPYFFRHMFRFMNMLPWGPWSVRDARLYAPSVRGLAQYYQVGLVVLLGRKVAEAMGFGSHNGATYYRVREVDGVKYVVLPHPSRRNRLWNDPVNVRRTTRFLRRWTRWASSSL